MFSVLIKIIPLDLAATLSPGILALVLVILASKNHSKAHAISLFLGSLLVGIGITFIGFSLGNSLNEELKPSLIQSVVDLILGLGLILYGLKVFFSKERKINLSDGKQELKILKWFGLGFIISATNFDALFLSFTAAKEVGTADIYDLTKIILLIVNLIFFTLPITLPVLLKTLFPKLAKPILEKIDQFVLRYGKYIVFGMFLIFGIVLLYQGIKFFF